MSIRWLTIFLWLAGAVRGQAPRYFAQLAEKDGLSDNYVQCILRDRSGYLWAGTAKGLNRWDGYAFRQYLPDSRRPNQSVSSEIIYDLKEDQKGYIWIATADGLNRYDPRTETFKVWKNTGRNDGSLPNSLVWNIWIDRHDALWLVCDNRDLCRFDPDAERFTTFPWKSFLHKARPEAARSDYQTIQSLSPRQETGLWCKTNFGLFSFDFASQTFDYHPVPPRAGPLVVGACSDALYMGALESDLLRFDACKRRWSLLRLPVHAPAGHERRRISDVFSMGKDHWILGKAGLFVLDGASLQITAVTPAAANRFTAPSGWLTCHFREPDGTLWVGGEQGLWRLDPSAQHFVYTPLKAGADKSVPNTFRRFVDSKVDGRRYISDFYEGRLLVFEGKKCLRVLSQPGPCGILHEDENGVLWVSFGKKIYQIDRHTLRLRAFPIPDRLLDPAVKSHFLAMARDAQGNIWFGNSDEGVLVWRPDRGDWWKPGAAEEFIGLSIQDLLADVQRRTVWIATADYGLFRFDASKRVFTLYQPEKDAPRHSLASYIVKSLCKDGQGRIWAAGELGGVSRFDYDAPTDRQFVSLSGEDGLPSNQVNAVLSDAAGNVWAATSKGLAWIDASSLQVRAFGKADGMMNDLLDLPLALSANGELLSGMQYGYQSFHPDSLLRDKPPARMLLTAFRVFDKDYSDTLNAHYLRQINLSWRQNFFTFDFAATNFSDPQKNEYAYRLADYDQDWRYLKNRHNAGYTGVPPGDYLLEIKTGREGRWQPPGIRLPIRITPPFWALWQFKALCILGVAGAAWGLHRRRVAALQKEERMKAEFDQRIARMEMTALRAQMNPHFVFNCLSSINRFILVNQPDEASNYLTKFSRLIRLILDNSRSETVTLDKELHALQLYIEMEQLRFNHRFEYSLAVADDVQPEHIEIPPLLIQPYVENAVWHGLMHKKEPGLLQIRVFYEQKTLCIEIEDDGVGRQKASELKSRSAAENKSYGMKVTAERLDAINQLYGAGAKVEIFDLTDAAGLPAGAKVRVCF